MEPALQGFGQGKLVTAPVTTTKAVSVTAPAALMRPREVIALRSRLIDRQTPPLQRLPVQALDDPLGVLTIRQVDKSEAARLPCGFIANHHRGSRLEPRIHYEVVEVRVRYFTRQVTNEESLRHFSPSG